MWDKTEIDTGTHQWRPEGDNRATFGIRDSPPVFRRGRRFCASHLLSGVRSSEAAGQVTSFLAILIERTTWSGMQDVDLCIRIYNIRVHPCVQWLWALINTTTISNDWKLLLHKHAPVVVVVVGSVHRAPISIQILDSTSNNLCLWQFIVLLWLGIIVYKSDVQVH